MEQRLGRGLSALLGETESINSENSPVSKVNIDLIMPNENQPRKHFDEEKLHELAESIKLHGILQPIAVRQVGDKYEIIAGERRWRASKMAGLSEIPVYFVSCDNNELMTLALIENLQRTDLNAIEEAEALKSLMELCDCSQNELGNLISKSRSYITNSLRLLSLPDKVRTYIREGKLSAGHGKILVGMPNAEQLAEMAISKALTVRQLENTLRELKVMGTSPTFDSVVKPMTRAGTPIDMNADPETIDIAVRVAEALHVETKLKITKRGGVFTLICKSCEELESLVEKLISLNDDNSQI